MNLISFDSYEISFDYSTGEVTSVEVKEKTTSRVFSVSPQRRKSSMRMGESTFSFFDLFNVGERLLVCIEIREPNFTFRVLGLSGVTAKASFRLADSGEFSRVLEG